MKRAKKVLKNFCTTYPVDFKLMKPYHYVKTTKFYARCKYLSQSSVAVREIIGRIFIVHLINLFSYLIFVIITCRNTFIV